MILVILGICILALVGGILMVAIDDWDHELISGSGVVLSIVSAVGGIIAIICACEIYYSISQLMVIDENIAMYQEENQIIETQIADTVRQYQEYEQNIFTEVAPESSVALVSLYPELRSDTLVQKQIETYVSNNNKIKELKAKKIQGKVDRWWGYFGK
jgi:hypothetical protein